MKSSRRLPDVGSRPLVPQQDRGRGSAVRRRVPEYLVVATVLAPWGIRGELKVRIETDFPDRFAVSTRLLLGPEHRPFEVQRFRQHGRGLGLLKLKGCDDRAVAEELRGMAVQVPLAEAVPLEPDEYYVHQIEGLTVCTEDGEHLGVIEEVLFTGSNEVYVARGPRGEVLIPALKDVVLSVDPQAGQMVVRLPPGLFD
jgi:16S rRNA processing protein RimM